MAALDTKATKVPFLHRLRLSELAVDMCPAASRLSRPFLEGVKAESPASGA